MITICVSNVDKTCGLAKKDYVQLIAELECLAEMSIVKNVLRDALNVKILTARIASEVGR